MRWTGHVARRGKEIHAGFWWKNGRKELEDLVVDGRIILKFILKK
jgi:hypothetical protein